NNPLSWWRPLGVIGIVLGAFIALVFIWYLVDEATGERYTKVLPVVFAVIVLGFVVLVLTLSLRDQFRWSSRIEPLISPREFDAAALSRSIGGIGLTLGELIARLEQIGQRLGPAVAVPQTDPAQLNRGRLYRLIAIGCAVIAVALVPFALMGTFLFALFGI